MDLDKHELDITKLLNKMRKFNKQQYEIAYKRKELHDDISKLLEEILKEK